MTNLWLKNCFNLLYVALSAFSLVACGNNTSSETSIMIEKIESLRQTSFSNMPEVINTYNTFNDSLASIDRKILVKLNNDVMNAISRDDSTQIAALVIMNNSEEVGIALGHICCEIALKNSSPDSIRNKINRLLEITRFMYEKSGEPSSIADMEHHFDKFFSSLPPQRQAEIYTALSTPEILAFSLLQINDSTSAQKIAKEARNIYKPDTTTLNRFNSIYTK